MMRIAGLILALCATQGAASQERMCFALAHPDDDIGFLSVSAAIDLNYSYSG